VLEVIALTRTGAQRRLSLIASLPVVKTIRDAPILSNEPISDSVCRAYSRCLRSFS